MTTRNHPAAITLYVYTPSGRYYDLTGCEWKPYQRSPWPYGVDTSCCVCGMPGVDGWVKDYGTFAHDTCVTVAPEPWEAMAGKGLLKGDIAR